MGTARSSSGPWAVSQRSAPVIPADTVAPLPAPIDVPVVHVGTPGAAIFEAYTPVSSSLRSCLCFFVAIHPAQPLCPAVLCGSISSYLCLSHALVSLSRARTVCLLGSSVVDETTLPHHVPMEMGSASFGPLPQSHQQSWCVCMMCWFIHQS